jgi:hypothetical protein
MEFEELGENRIKQLSKMPIIETRISKSKDGKYLVHRTQIVDIKPVEYWEKVFDAS